jgi:membrane-associated phospholipid phosphatase
MVVALAIYDFVLVIAILLLEMHYVIDLIAGVVVAGVSIAICGGPLRKVDCAENKT